MTDYKIAENNAQINLQISRLKKKIDVFNFPSVNQVMQDLIEISNNFDDMASKQSIIEKLKNKYKKEVIKLEKDIITKYKQTEIDYGTRS